MPGCTIVTGVSPHSLDVDLLTQATLEASSDTIVNQRDRAGTIRRKKVFMGSNLIFFLCICGHHEFLIYSGLLLSSGHSDGSMWK